MLTLLLSTILATAPTPGMAAGPVVSCENPATGAHRAIFSDPGTVGPVVSYDNSTTGAHRSIFSDPGTASPVVSYDNSTTGAHRSTLADQGGHLVKTPNPVKDTINAASDHHVDR